MTRDIFVLFLNMKLKINPNQKKQSLPEPNSEREEVRAAQRKEERKNRRKNKQRERYKQKKGEKKTEMGFFFKKTEKKKKGSSYFILSLLSYLNDTLTFSSEEKRALVSLECLPT